MYAVGAYLEVLGDGLAVRTGPGTDHPLIAEFLVRRERDPITVEKLRDSVRLPAGYVVRVELGPVVVDDRAWYAVRNVAQVGQPDEDVASWASKAPVPYTDVDFDLTWLAASEPGALFVRTTDRPASACPCYGDGPPPSVVATGVGDGRVGPWNNDRVAFIQIAASPVSEDGNCDFTFTGGDGSDPWHSEVGTDSFEALLPGVDVAPGKEEAVLRVRTDCAWAVVVDLAQ